MEYLLSALSEDKEVKEPVVLSQVTAQLARQRVLVSCTASRRNHLILGFQSCGPSAQSSVVFTTKESSGFPRTTNKQHRPIYGLNSGTHQPKITRTHA